MNSFIVMEGDTREGGVVFLDGIRARALAEQQNIELGQEIRFAVYGGGKGTARVAEVSSDRCVLHVLSEEPSLELKPIDLIIGVSRPQTVKKVIQAGVMIGVRSIHFVRTEHGEKSYLTSSALRPDSIVEETVKALGQIGEGRYPEVRVHHSFGYFFRNHLETLAHGTDRLRVIAHPAGADLTSGGVGGGARPVVLAVGPEAGWSDSELEAFRERGFYHVGLGTRVMRVEVALVFLLGQIELLMSYPQG